MTPQSRMHLESDRLEEKVVHTIPAIASLGTILSFVKYPARLAPLG